MRIEPGKSVRLRDIDPADADGLTKEETEDDRAKIQAQLEELQELMYAEHKRRLLIVLQGMDTSGKDGTIRFLMGGLSSLGTRIVSFKKPTETELEHDYLWRVHQHVPGNGETVIFNRSHYEDVLVVRVHNLVPPAVWRKRFDQINEFERLLADTGTTILKFFLHISKKEQKERLEERVADPTKRWKFNHGDLEERKLWNSYAKAYEDVLEKTSTAHAPWFVIPSDRKWLRNLRIGTAVVETLRKLKMAYPEVDLSDVVVR
jgi:PPK2 family polyphosphate:nucleotide phosphotransferase